MERRRWIALILCTLVGIGLLASTTTTASAEERRPTHTPTTPTAPTRADQLGGNVDPGVDPPWEPAPFDVTDIDRPPTGPGELTAPTPEPPRPKGPDDKKAPEVRVVPDGCVGGRMLDYSYQSGEYLPSYGWRVYLWFYEGSIGSEVARNVWVGVGPDGTWQYCPGDILALGKQFAYVYVAKNKWIEMNDASPGPYSGVWFWNPISYGMGMPPQPGIYPDAPYLDHHPNGQLLPTDKLYTGKWNDHDDDNDGRLDNSKAEADDNDSGETEDFIANYEYGVGDLMRWAMETFAKLDHEGVEPAPKGPHSLSYPTSSCTGGTACYSGGTIKLPLDAGLFTKYTVQHEVGHAIVDDYWAGKGVDPVGGTHEIGSCASDSKLAYQEALATYISMWTHNLDDGNLPHGYSDGDPFNPEDPPVCQWLFNDDGATAEEYVAAVFWDLQDHRVDGDDTLGMAEEAGMLEWLLHNPMEDAHQLRSVLLDVLPDHKTWIKGVFSQHDIG